MDKSHRKIAKARKGRNYGVQIVIGPDGLGTEDHFSHLPDDCILEVFKLLSRLQLYNIMTINKRILPLCYHESLHHIKWQANELCIYQTQLGYGFELVTPWKEPFYPYRVGHPLPFKYQYEIIQSEDGSFTERKTTKDPDHFHQEQHSEPPHSWPIPDQFFDAVAERLTLHEASTVRIAKIPFDAAVIDKLKDLLKGHKIAKVACADMSWPQATTEDEAKKIRKSFATFIEKIRIVNMETTAPNPLVNQEFLHGDSLPGRELVCNTCYEIGKITLAQTHRFYPDVSIIDHISSFNRLDALTMTLNVNWVVELVMKNMEAIPIRDMRVFNIWRFSVDRPITSDIITQQMQQLELKYSSAGDFYSSGNYIKRKSNGKSARLDNIEYRTAAGLMHAITVHFLNF